MAVGLRIEASPLHPRLILLLLSVSVVGVEYPMGTPVKRHKLSESNSKTWANGKNLEKKIQKSYQNALIKIIRKIGAM